MSSMCQVAVSEGVLQGKEALSKRGKEYFSFLGIPYAEPPVNELRFKAPVQKRPWTGVLDATSEGSCAPQLDMLSKNYVGNEDCLYLNVHTPSLPKDDKKDQLPVMVFIHGGAFLFMSGSTDWFTPDYLIESEVILVTINYRLSVMGFLCLDTPDVPGNAGLKDQNLALKWIKTNISKFNGDSNNITIFGISSGAVSVEYHLLSPLSEGFFDKAIMQSGSALNPWARTRTPKKTTAKLVKLLNIQEKDSEKILEILQNVKIEKIISVAFQLTGDEEYKNCDMFSFTPVVEKKFQGVQAFLDEDPLDLLKNGKFSKVPSIAGFCSVEGFLLKTNFSETLLKQLNNKEFTDFIPDYYKIDKKVFEERFSEIYADDLHKNVDNFLSDMNFLSGIMESVILRSINNEKRNYLYEFSYDGKLNFLKSVFRFPVKGSLHGDDSTYLSSSKYVDESVITTDDQTVRRRMVQMWTDFAKFGDPTPEQFSLIPTKWLPITNTDSIMLMDINTDLKMTPLPYPERMELWKNVYSNQ